MKKFASFLAMLATSCGAAEMASEPDPPVVSDSGTEDAGNVCPGHAWTIGYWTCDVCECAGLPCFHRNEDGENVEGICDELLNCSAACPIPGGATGFLPPYCNDGVLNHGESAVDCGGPLINGCLRCPAESSCQVGTDCESGTCSDGACAP